MSGDRFAAQSAGSGVFTAADINCEMAEREAAKAADDLRHTKEQEEKQKSLVQELHKPFDKSADQLMRLVMQLVRHAAEHGQSEVQVYRFPNSMCSDRGRINNNSEPGWDTNLEGRPKFAYEFWHDHLRPLGFTSMQRCSNIQSACPAISALSAPGRERDFPAIRDNDGICPWPEGLSDDRC